MHAGTLGAYDCTGKQAHLIKEAILQAGIKALLPGIQSLFSRCKLGRKGLVHPGMRIDVSNCDAALLIYGQDLVQEVATVLGELQLCTIRRAFSAEHC